MPDMVYGCDGCRTTLGRQGCPTHRDSNRYTDEAGAYHYTGSDLVMTHCRHGLDLRLYPRCYLCRPEPTGSFATGGNGPDPRLAARDCPPCGPCCAEHPHWSHVHTDQFVGPSIECLCGDVFRSVVEFHEHIHLSHPEADHA